MDEKPNEEQPEKTPEAAENSENKKKEPENLEPVKVSPPVSPLEKVDNIRRVLFITLWIVTGVGIIGTIAFPFAPPAVQSRIKAVWRHFRQEDYSEKKEQRSQVMKEEFLEAGDYKNMPEGLHIIIYKSKGELELLDGSKVLYRYKIALGREPTGDKKKEGDFKTPLGTFYVCTKNSMSKFHLFLGLSYPNDEDAGRGLEAGLINKKQYNAILAAQKNKRQPPWNTQLGGEIGIHGNGSSGNWTAGCIAVENKEIERLFGLCEIGTRVEIRK